MSRILISLVSIGVLTWLLVAGVIVPSSLVLGLSLSTLHFVYAVAIRWRFHRRWPRNHPIHSRLDASIKHSHSVLWLFRPGFIPQQYWPEIFPYLFMLLSAVAMSLLPDDLRLPVTAVLVPVLFLTPFVGGPVVRWIGRQRLHVLSDAAVAFNRWIKRDGLGRLNRRLQLKPWEPPKPENAFLEGKELFERRAKPAAFMVIDDAASTNRSFLGGLPPLEEGTAWPTHPETGEPMIFLAAIAGSEVPAFEGGPALPQEGMLLVFVGTPTSAYLPAGSERRLCEVIHARDPGPPRPAPEALRSAGAVAEREKAAEDRLSTARSRCLNHFGRQNGIMDSIRQATPDAPAGPQWRDTLDPEALNFSRLKPEPKVFRPVSFSLPPHASGAWPRRPISFTIVPVYDDFNDYIDRVHHEIIGEAHRHDRILRRRLLLGEDEQTARQNEQYGQRPRRHSVGGPADTNANPTGGTGVKLFQFDNDDTIGWAWPEQGTMEIWISPEALADGAWEDAGVYMAST